MNNFFKIFLGAYFFCFLVWADADLEKQITDMQDQIDALAEALEEGSESADEAGWWTRTSIGGYGEIHWSNSSTPVDESVTRIYFLSS